MISPIQGIAIAGVIALAVIASIAGRGDGDMNAPVNWRGQFFSPREVTASRTARALGIPNEPNRLAWERANDLAFNALDPLRRIVGPITVTSWYRSPRLNVEVDGAEDSQHMTGGAADIKVSGMSMNARQLGAILLKAGIPFDQLIGYADSAGGQLHVSYRKGRNRGDIRWTASKGGRAVSVPRSFYTG